MTRDSAIWWLGIAVAVVGYLAAAGDPRAWGYADIIKFLAAVLATISGKLASSPLPHSDEK